MWVSQAWSSKGGYIQKAVSREETGNCDNGVLSPWLFRHLRKPFSLYLENVRKKTAFAAFHYVYEQVQGRVLESKIAILRVTELIYKTCTIWCAVNFFMVKKCEPRTLWAGHSESGRHLQWDLCKNPPNLISVKTAGAVVVLSSFSCFLSLMAAFCWTQQVSNLSLYLPPHWTVSTCNPMRSPEQQVSR